jgi:hypothetical protein
MSVATKLAQRITIRSLESKTKERLRVRAARQRRSMKVLVCCGRGVEEFAEGDKKPFLYVQTDTVLFGTCVRF